MLTNMNLDHENFEDLVEEAKNRIASDYPEWTDFNYHDPGITFSELFAFFKEIAQYRINFIGQRHFDKYLKLLGIHREPVRPAMVQVSLSCDRTCILPPLTRFYASGVCFENITAHLLVANDISGCICQSDSTFVQFDRRLLKMTKTLRIPVFGKNAEPGSSFYMMFDEPLPELCPLSLYAGVRNDRSVVRNPIGASDSFFPLSGVVWEYYSDQGWMACEHLSDKTFGFLQSGWISFEINHPMSGFTVAQTDGYFLRARLISSEYDVAPELYSISMNMAEAMQVCHYAVYQDADCRRRESECICTIEVNRLNEQNIAVLVPGDGLYRIYENFSIERRERFWDVILRADQDGRYPDQVRILSWDESFDTSQIAGTGNGLPGQEFSLEDMDIYSGAFELMVEEPGTDGALSPWERVDDFDCSGPKSRHYRLDLSRRRLVFGDCIHGMAPEGNLLITAFATCEGARGNVKKSKIDRIEDGFLGLAVANDNNAAFGRDAEAVDECFMRAKKALYSNVGLVTEADYETAVRNTPGLMIENCKMIYPSGALGAPGETGCEVCLVVKPFSLQKNARLGQAYMKNIHSWLEDRRMIGTRILLLSPEYVQLSVFVECKGRNNYMYDREAIIRAMGDYFHKFSVNFGGTISHSSIYELLDRLENVESMEAFSMEVQGNRVTRTVSGDIMLPPEGLLDLNDIEYNISIN